MSDMPDRPSLGVVAGQSDPFHALIEAEAVIEAVYRGDAVSPEASSTALKRVRSALQYLRTHSLHNYVDPKTVDGRD
jgi:hypothetical protein